MIKTEDITKLSLREIGAKIGVMHPQSVKYHLSHLIGAGFVAHKTGSKALKIASRIEKSGIVNIPILGDTNYTREDFVSMANTTANLRVASSILSKEVLKNINRVYAIKVFGNLMNRANIADKTIEDGDYVLIDFTAKNPKSGEIVLSVTQGFGAIRKYLKDGLGQILLITQSTQDYPPIYLDDRIEHYVLGQVLQVIKKPVLS